MRATRRLERRLEALRGLVRQPRADVGDARVTRAAVLVNEASNLRWRLDRLMEVEATPNIDADDTNADWLKPCRP